MRKRLWFAAALATFAGCVLLVLGPDRGAAAFNGVYQPPAGWHRTQYLGRGLGTWIDPANGQTISVEATDYAGSLEQLTHAKLAGIQSLPEVRVGAAQQATVCRSHPATYITFQAAENGVENVYETMLAIWSGVAYQATYVRSLGQRSLYEARQSLTTLCGGIAPPAQPAAQSQQPFVRPSAPQTPNLGPTQAPEQLGSPAPTVTPGEKS